MYVPTSSYITINTSNGRRKRRRREAKSAIKCCTDFIVRPYSIHLMVGLYNMLYTYIHNKKSTQSRTRTPMLIRILEKESKYKYKYKYEYEYEYEYEFNYE